MKVESIVGLPWQLAEPLLQAASIPFRVEVLQNYNKFFSVSSKGYYVGRVVQEALGEYVISLYRPMVYSDFEEYNEVVYAKEIMEK